MVQGEYSWDLDLVRRGLPRLKRGTSSWHSWIEAVELWGMFAACLDL